MFTDDAESIEASLQYRLHILYDELEFFSKEQWANVDCGAPSCVIMRQICAAAVKAAVNALQASSPYTLLATLPDRLKTAITHEFMAYSVDTDKTQDPDAATCPLRNDEYYSDLDIRMACEEETGDGATGWGFETHDMLGYPGPRGNTFTLQLLINMLLDLGDDTQRQIQDITDGLDSLGGIQDSRRVERHNTRVPSTRARSPNSNGDFYITGASAADDERIRAYTPSALITVTDTTDSTVPAAQQPDAEPQGTAATDDAIRFSSDEPSDAPLHQSPVYWIPPSRRHPHIVIQATSNAGATDEQMSLISILMSFMRSQEHVYRNGLDSENPEEGQEYEPRDTPLIEEPPAYDIGEACSPTREPVVTDAHDYSPFVPVATRASENSSAGSASNIGDNYNSDADEPNTCISDASEL